MGKLPDNNISTFVQAGITFYKDHEAMEKARIENVLSIDPLSRIKNTVELIKRVYQYDSIIKSNIPKKLHFK